MAEEVKTDSEILEWRPVETAPWQQVIWVKNDLMEHPVKATRGYTYNGAVCEDGKLFTSVYTPDPEGFFPTPSGQLVCPTQWAECGDQS